MPNAIGGLIAQSDLKDLGVHTEMYVDAFVDIATVSYTHLDVYKRQGHQCALALLAKDPDALVFVKISHCNPMLLSSDQVLLGQSASQLCSGIVASQHSACALLRRSEGLEDVRRRTLQTDGIDLDQRIVLQSVVIEHFHRLVVAGCLLYTSRCV